MIFRIIILFTLIINVCSSKQEHTYILEFRDEGVFESFDSGANYRRIISKSQKIKYLGSVIVSNLENFQLLNYDFYEFFDLYGNKISINYIQKNSSIGIFILLFKKNDVLYSKKILYIK
jgi:hypothetical protein